MGSASTTMNRLSQMNQDPDIRLEAAVTAATGTATQHHTIPLNAFAGAHRASKQTTALAQNAGGLEKFREMTNAFYRKAFADPQLDPFIRSHEDPHGERFASWIAEKMGLGQPWTQERRTRKTCPFHSHGHSIDSAHDRSSAHFAAWHSPKRPREKFGTHFKLDDCRVWMRLHFWAAREVGLFDTAFGEYYVKFIAHFVSVYERTAPMFARDSARWSLDAANIQKYKDDGLRMSGIVGLRLEEALQQIPEDERRYTGSNARVLLWPYGE